MRPHTAIYNHVLPYTAICTPIYRHLQQPHNSHSSPHDGPPAAAKHQPEQLHSGPCRRTAPHHSNSSPPQPNTTIYMYKKKWKLMFLHPQWRVKLWPT